MFLLLLLLQESTYYIGCQPNLKIEGNTYDDVLVVIVVAGINVLVANPT